MRWSDFDRFVMPHVAGCPLPVMEHHALMTCIDWCTRTHCWRESLDPEASMGLPEFELSTDAGREIVKVLAVSADGHNIEPVSPDIGRAYTLGHHPGDYCFTVDNLVLQVYQPPKAGALVAADVALAPTIDATGMPDALFRQYARDIAPGIIASLQELGGQPFSDLVRVDRNRPKYEAKLRSVAASVSVGNMRAKTVSRSSFF